jgi:hypothetical protein
VQCIPTLQGVLLQACSWYHAKVLSVFWKLLLSSIAPVGTEGQPAPKEHDVQDLPDRVRPAVMIVFKLCADQSSMLHAISAKYC